MITTEELYLKIPTEEDEQIVMEARAEFLQVESRIPGAGSLEKNEVYSDWLEKVVLDLSEKTVPAGRVPSTQYLTMRKSDNKLVGFIQLRHHINHEHLSKFGGHIGDSIRPTERNKGYATKQIQMVCEIAKSMGIEKVLITCKDWNKASARTIEKSGGVFESEIVDAEGTKFERFWISTK